MTSSSSRFATVFAALALVTACSAPPQEDVGTTSAELLVVPASASARKLGVDRYTGTKSGDRLAVAALDATGALLGNVRAEATKSSLAMELERRDVAVKLFADRFEVTARGRTVVVSSDEPNAEDKAFLDELAKEIGILAAAVDDTGFGARELEAGNDGMPNVDTNGVKTAGYQPSYWVRGQGFHLARSIACYNATNDANRRCTNRACWGCQELLSDCDCWCPGQIAGGDYLCACFRSGRACGYNY